MTKPSRYARDPAYFEAVDWDILYRVHHPQFTCPASRGAKLISENLRDKNAPLRQILVGADFDLEHMASSIEATVKALWEARARIAELEGKGGE